jgi:RHS repeat-associated protein
MRRLPWRMKERLHPPTRGPSTRTAALAAAALLAFWAPGAPAQTGITGDTQAPTLPTVVNTTFTGAAAPQAPGIKVCDATSIDDGSLGVWLNGTAIASRYAAGTVPASPACPGGTTATKLYALTSSAPLVKGANAFRVAICDGLSNCTDRTVTLTWANAVPTVTIAPASRKVASPSLFLSVTFSDDDTVRTSTAHFVLNGTDVTQLFTPTSQQGPASASFTGTVLLSTSGTNTFQASVSDNVGQSSGLVPATYTVGNTAPTVSFTAPARTGAASPGVSIVLHEDDQQITSTKVWMNGVAVTGLGATYGVYDITLSGSVAAAVGDNVLTAEACSAGGCGRDSVHVFRYTAAQAAPVLGLDPTNQDWLLRSPSEVSTAYATPAYFSRDHARGVVLTYASGRASPVAFVQVDASDYSSTPPSQMMLWVLDSNGAKVPGLNGSTTNVYLSGNGTSRLGLRFSATSLPTGVYGYTAVVRSYWPDGSFQETTAPVRVMVVNDYDSPYGAGWYVAGLQRIFGQGNSSLLVDNGDGTAELVAYTGTTPDGVRHYLPPAGDFTTLTYSTVGGVGRYTRMAPDSSTVVFDASGWMTQAKNRLGVGSTYTYWGAGSGRANLLASITDAAGKVIQLADSTGLLSAVTLPDERVVRMGYATSTGPSPNLARITDPDGVAALLPHYSSSVPHLLDSWTDRAGGAWSLAFDAQREVRTVTTPAASLSVGGTPQSSSTQVRSLAAAVVPATATSQATPAARVTPGMAWMTVVAPNGDSTSVQFDHWGAAWRARDAQGRTAVVLRNGQAQDTLSVSATGDTVRNTWTGPDVTTRVSSAGTETMTYDRFHQLLTHTWGTEDLDVSNTYDAVTGLLGRSWMSGVVTKYTYDTAGRVKTVADSAGRTTTYTYEASAYQNLASVTTPNGAAVSYQHDGAGRVSTVTDPRGAVTTATYDALNRQLTSAGPLADTVRVAFQSANGSYLSSVTDPIGQQYGFSPNVLGWNLSETDPRSHATKRTFDMLGAVTQVQDRRGQIVQTRYDVHHRPLAIYADGDSTTFAYDSAGLFTVVRNAASLDTLRFDPAGRLTEAVTVRGSRRYVVRSTYVEGRRVGVSTGEDVGPSALAGGVMFDYRFDGGRLHSVYYYPNGDTISFKYNADGTLAYSDMPAGVRTSYTYTNGITFPVGTTYGTTSGAARADLNRAAGELLLVDSLGRVNGWTLGTQDSSYVYRYDLGGRLIESAKYATGHTADGTVVTCSSGLTTGFQCQAGGTYPSPSELLQYTYDRAGNRADRGAVIGTGNRLNAFNGLTMEHDSAGNVTRMYKASSGVVTWDRQLTWNSLGQLTRVCTNGSCIGYRYDGLGRRVARTDGSGTVIGQWVHDGDQLALEMDGAGNVTAAYSYLPGTDMPLTVTRGGQRYFYLRDHLGSIRALVGSTGQLVNQYRYDAWGQRVLASEGVLNNVQFAAREIDQATDLYYNRARYYSPGLARFVSEDPIRLAGGMNLYAYVGNDPVNFTDPSGLRWCTHGTGNGGKHGTRHFTSQGKEYVIYAHEDGSYTICEDPGSAQGNFVSGRGPVPSHSQDPVAEGRRLAAMARAQVEWDYQDQVDACDAAANDAITSALKDAFLVVFTAAGGGSPEAGAWLKPSARWIMDYNRGFWIGAASTALSSGVDYGNGLGSGQPAANAFPFAGTAKRFGEAGEACSGASSPQYQPNPFGTTLTHY